MPNQRPVPIRPTTPLPSGILSTKQPAPDVNTLFVRLQKATQELNDAIAAASTFGFQIKIDSSDPEKISPPKVLIDANYLRRFGVSGEVSNETKSV